MAEVKKLVLVLLLLPAMALGGDGRCKDVLLKAANQVLHLATGRFFLMRRLNERLRNVPVSRRWVPLSGLRHMHPLDYPLGMMRDKLRAREQALYANMALVASGFSIEEQRVVLPSGGAIRVVEYPDGTFLVKDGNSRLAALKAVFPSGDVMVEVEQYDVRDQRIFELIGEFQRVSGL